MIRGLALRDGFRLDGDALLPARVADRLVVDAADRLRSDLRDSHLPGNVPRRQGFARTRRLMVAARRDIFIIQALLLACASARCIGCNVALVYGAGSSIG